jgi:chromosome segregation ATPase
MRRPDCRRRAAALALATAVLGACAVPTPVTERTLLDELRAVQQMDSDALLAEDARLAQATSTRERLLRAALLAAPAHPQRDVAAAQRALEREAAATDDRSAVKQPPPWRDLAAALALWLAEQQRADGLRQQRLADEIRLGQLEARARELERRLQEAERRLAEADRRAQEAQRKLETLRTIEKEMSGRTPETR